LDDDRFVCTVPRLRGALAQEADRAAKKQENKKKQKKQEETKHMTEDEQLYQRKTGPQSCATLTRIPD